MSAQIKDGGVVDVRRALGQADVALGVAGLWQQNIFRLQLRAAAVAVAELIEADIMLDRTQEAYDRAAAGCIRNDLWDDVLAARKRRATALANVGSTK